MQAGIIASIHRFPVKSMMGEELNAAHVTVQGLRGDRAYALADRETGKVASAKNPAKWPSLFQFRATFTEPVAGGEGMPPVRITLPDGEMVTSEDADAEARLSASLGRAVRLLKSAPKASVLEEYWPDMEELQRRDVVTDEALPSETFFDLGTIHLLTTATLGSLQALYPQGRFEPRRFRPNFVIDTGSGAGGFPENDWHERILAVGDRVRMKVTGPCGRCVMTTLPQGDLPKDTAILKTAAKHNEARVGIYAEVLDAGPVRRGDAVRVT